MTIGSSIRSTGVLTAMALFSLLLGLGGANRVSAADTNMRAADPTDEVRLYKRLREKLGTAPCNSPFGVVSVTNGAAVSLNAVKNRGDCTFTLKCEDGDPLAAVGVNAQQGQVLALPPGYVAASFVCPATATHLRLIPGGGAGNAILQWVP